MVSEFPLSDDCPEFFKVFLPYTSSHQISIPPAFIRHFNGAIPKKAIIFDHTKKPWHVTLEQTEGRLCFKKGWQCFASHHSLEFGDFMVFKYNRNSAFEVKIFSKTGCKKGKTIPFVDLEEDSEPEKTCRRPTCVGKRKHSEIALKKNQEPGSPSKAGRQKLQGRVETNIEEENIQKVAGFVAPKNPYFVVAFANHMQYTWHFQNSVINAFKIIFNGSLVIRDRNGNPWPVKVCSRNDGRFAISTGWSDLAKKNNLRVGDQCVFEFVLGRENLCNEMHLQILRGTARLENFRLHSDLQKKA